MVFKILRKDKSRNYAKSQSGIIKGHKSRKNHKSEKKCQNRRDMLTLQENLVHTLPVGKFDDKTAWRLCV
jgi:hypothetical protein